MKNTYTSHVDSAIDRTSKTSTENEEGSVDKESISGTTKEQESVGRGLSNYKKCESTHPYVENRAYLEVSLLSKDVVGSVDERHFEVLNE